MTQFQKINLYFPLSLTLVLFGLLSIFYGTVVSDWRFFDDDYGAVFIATTTKKLADVKTFFTSNHNDKTIMPTNILQKHKDSFSTTSFRPLTLVYYWLVAKIFDPLYPQRYYSLSIFLHLIVTIMLFFAFRNYLRERLAFLAALLFGVFPYSGKFLGRFVIQPYSLVMILNLTAYFILLKSFKKDQYWPKVIAAFLWGASLLMHEVGLSFLIMYLLLCFFSRQHDFYFNRVVLLHFILDSLPFVGVFLGYFFAKYLAYPQLDAQLAALSFFHKIKYRFYDFVTLVFDALGYSFIPGGHQYLKAGLFIVDAAILSSLMVLGFNFFSATLLILFAVQSWPCILVMHVSRYLYFAMPFFLLSLFFSYQQLLEKRCCPKLEKILDVLLKLKYLTVLICGIFAIRKDLQYLEKKFIFTDNAIRKLSKRLVAKGNLNNLCFLGLPFDHFPVSGLAQAVWFYTKNDNRKIFYDVLHSVRFDKIDKLPSDNFYAIKLGVSKHNRKIIKFKFTIDDKCSAYILVANPFGLPIDYSMGKISFVLKNGSDSHAKAIDVLLDLKQKHFQLVSWDYKRNIFKLLNVN